MINGLLQDIRYAFRGMRKSPGFAAIAIATLALGIGANTAIFSVVHGVLLKPLPFDEPDRLVRVFDQHEGMRWTVSPPNFVDYREGAASFESMAALHTTSYALTGAGGAEQVPAARATPGLFDVLRAAPAHGRTFTPDDGLVGRDRVAVISHGLWQRRFGGDPGVVGRTIRLDGDGFTVVGITSPGFAFPRGVEVWTALAFDEEDLTTQRGAHYLDVLARLAPGATLDRAVDELERIGGRLAAEYPSTNRDMSATAAPLHETIVGDVRPALLILLGAVGLVLLIACVNVANLLLARMVGRSRELAVRTALGAGRGRLVRQLLTESLVLAAIGAAAGLLVALWGTELLKAIQPGDIPRVDAVAVDGTVLVFAAGVMVVTALLFGLMPAFYAASGLDLVSGLKEGGRGAVGSRRGRRARRALVVAEMALAVTLLVGAGLLTRSFLGLQRVELGFETRGVQTFNVSLPDARYTEPGQADRFFTELLERIDGLPGVERSAAVFGLPLSGFGYSISVEELDGRAAAEDGREPSVQVRAATPGYFETMGIRILRGRGLSPEDRHGRPPVAVVNESAAQLLWPGEEPLGRDLELGTSFGLDRGRARGRVVGIIADMKARGPASDARPQVYVAHPQFPVDFMSIVVRMATPTSVMGPARAELAAIDPNVPVFGVRTMEELAGQAVAQPRFYVLLLGIFGVAALILAAIGIYGVLAHMVMQQTREIGVRLALGARAGDVLRSVVARALATAAAGVALGLVVAAALSRTLSGLLFQVSPVDPPTFAAVAVVLTLAAVAASYVPARRAARTDPMVALRTE